MKTNVTQQKAFICLLLVPIVVISLLPDKALAQPQTLEFASGGGPTGSGPSISPQVITFQNNTNNPTGTTFATFTPTTTVTFSLSNQQYTLPVTETATATPLMFGAGNTNATPAVTSYTYYNLLNAYSASVNGDYTSASTVTAGTGIAITKNYGLQVFTSAMELYHAGASTSGRYYIGNLTITFSAEVTNPVIHVTGLGATVGSLGFSTELELQTSSVTLSKLSGSTELTVSAGTKILNNATTIGGTTGSGAASGSVLATGSNITSLTFKVYLRGDGGGTVWATGNHIGDGWLLSVSTITALIVLPQTITNFTATPRDTYAQLQWDGETQENNRFFNIESSKDGVVWKTIGKLAADNSSIYKTYQYTDASAAAGNNYYRIKEGNVQGDTVYSPVRLVSLDGNFPLSIFPNPVKDKLYFTNNGEAVQSVVISNTAGKEIQHYTNLVSGNSLDMSAMPVGMYIVTVRYASGHVQAMKVLKK